RASLLPHVSLYLPFLSTLPLHSRSSVFPYTTLFRSAFRNGASKFLCDENFKRCSENHTFNGAFYRFRNRPFPIVLSKIPSGQAKDRKSTRLNSSHVKNSYAVFCLKKKRRIRGRTWWR